jgi:hypothetical protein
MITNHPPGPPMDLANMRELGLLAKLRFSLKRSFT